MRDETLVTLGFGLFALLLGTWLTRVRARHLAKVRAEREAGRFVPLFDARGAWLFLNGPVTLLLGLGFVANGAWRAWREHEALRMARELDAVALTCEPGALRVDLAGAAPRRLSLALHAVGRERDAVVVPLSADLSAVSLAPGGRRAFALGLRSSHACGREVTELDARADAEARARALEAATAADAEPYAALGVLSLLAPELSATGRWPECDALRVELVVHDPSGAELARDTRLCPFPGRTRPLVLDPGLLY